MPTNILNLFVYFPNVRLCNYYNLYLMFRKIFYIPIALILCLAVVPYFIDLSSYAEPHLADIQRTVGRTIKTGAIRLQILPTPRLKMYDVKLGNSPDSKDPEMAKIESAEVILSLVNLLKGKIVVKSVDLKSPEISLEKNKKGEANWNLTITNTEKEEKPDTKEKKPEVNAATAGFVIKNLNISNAKIKYTDHKEGTQQNFTNLNINLTSEHMFGPYTARIRTQFNENPVDFEIHTGAINLNGLTPVETDISVNYQGQEITIKLKGSIDCLNECFSGDFKATTLGLPIVVEFPNQKIDLKKSIDALGKLEITKDQVKLSNLNIKHPVVQLSGLLDYKFASMTLSTSLKLKHQEDLIYIDCSSKNLKAFEYHLSSERYQNILKWFTKNDFNDPDAGPMNAKGLLKLQPEQIVLENTILNIGSANLQANISINTITNKITANAHTPNIKSWGNLFGQTLPVTGPAKIDSTITPTDSGSSVFAKIAFGKGNILFDGNLGNQEALANGKLTLEHFDFGFYNINLKSNINVTKTKVDLNIQKIHVKNSSTIDVSAGGDISIDLSKEIPHIAGSISADPIQLTSYENGQVYFMKAVYSPEFFQYQLMQIARENSRWSSERIKLPLNSFTMNLEIKVPKITLADLIFESLKSNITLNSGKLSVPFSAKLYGGKLNGALLVNSEKEQHINLSANFDSISIEKIKAAAEHFKGGKAFGQIDLKTSGNSQYDWVSGLQGQAQFNVKEGIVKGFDLQKIVGIFKKPKNLLDLGSLQSAFDGSGETAFSNASAKFKVKGGVASTNDLIIETHEAQLKAEGQADLLNWHMLFNGQVVVPSLADVAPLKFKIKGPLDKPSYHLDYKHLQKSVVQNTIGDLLSKVTGGKKVKNSNTPTQKDESPQSSGSDQPQENKPQRPEKIVKDLLKGFLG